MATSDNEGLSIGALAQATGISGHTLRMWERRYGAPIASRRSSGHRRYDVAEVERLRLVQRALSHGFKPSQVVASSLAEIQTRIDEIESKLKPSGWGWLRSSHVTKDAIQQVARWIELSKEFNEHQLNTEMIAASNQLGLLGFVNDRAALFSKKLGEEWAAGRLSIAEEHFASECLVDFLSSHWRKANATNLGGSSTFVLTTLPNDAHRLGLHMCALMLVSLGHRVLFLGPQTPLEETVRAAQKLKSKHVCVSVSSAMDREYARRQLTELRQLLMQTSKLVCGGDGCPDVDIPGIHRFQDLMTFHKWAGETKAASAAVN